MKALNRTLAVIIAIFCIIALAGCGDPAGNTSTWVDENGDGFDDNTHLNKDGDKYIDGYDWEGYGEDGYDSAGYSRDGYDATGYNAKGWHKDGRATNKSGKPYDADGYLRDGTTKWYETIDGVQYDYNGWNELGWNKDNRPLNQNGTYFDINGNTFDGGRYHEGYDVNGKDARVWVKLDIQQMAGLTDMETWYLNNASIYNDQSTLGLKSNSGMLDDKADTIKKIFNVDLFSTIQDDNQPDVNTRELIARVQTACGDSLLGGVRTKLHADDVVTDAVKAISYYIVSMNARMNNGTNFEQRLDAFRLDAYNTFAGTSTTTDQQRKDGKFDIETLTYELSDAFTIHPDIMKYLLLQIKNVEEYFALRDEAENIAVSSLVLGAGGDRIYTILQRNSYDLDSVMASIPNSNLEPYMP